MKTLKTSLVATLSLGQLLLLFGSALAAAPDGAEVSAPQRSDPIPMDQLGTVAGKQYSGDGLKVTPTAEGARLRCVFQKLEGQATREGLWLTSTVEGAKNERFRLVAASVGRTVGTRSTRVPEFRNPNGDAVERIPTSFDGKRLPGSGSVFVDGQTVRFVRPGVTEEYSVSMDGVRQDFVVQERPEGAGQLRVELDVAGAKVEPLVNGARLVLDGSGRKIAYSRLRATDTTGKVLKARMEAQKKSENRNPKSKFDLAVVVDDADAIYPVRIDPTFSDENWISMGGVPGADSQVDVIAVDDTGNLYIGGWFSAAGV